MKKILLSFLAVFMFLMYGAMANAQTGVKGAVKDAEYSQPLVGASVTVKGTTIGTLTDANGIFSMPVDAGEVQLVITFLGYEVKEVPVTVKSGKMTEIGVIQLLTSAETINEIFILADRAKERETPVAISSIEKVQIEQQLGSRDIPLIMNSTPSVYSTQQGGGAGDARINVRGFDQKNVAIMINGVPINDMENGWVYWSNWDGLADATSSIQMQRGLSAVNLATPSIGGTMNIVTSPADHKAGGSAKFEYGSGNFFKATVSGNSGLINDKFAVSATIVRKIGEGIIDNTYTNAWAYYFGAMYKLNDKHKLELFAVGAPQRHGQNSYKQNIAAYDADYAKDLGFTDEALAAKLESKDGRFYNENWNYVNAGYEGKQYWNGKEHDRQSSGVIAERENYYHKPLINLNWYGRFTDKVSLFTTAYYSGGQGGGSGTLGSMRWDYASQPSRIVDWNATIARNSDPVANPSGAAFGILRNSVNNQWTVGALSKLRILFTEKLKGSVGVDWRTAQIEHFREVRNLLGATYFVDDNNEFESGTQYNKYLGDIIDYNFTNKVNWFGYYGQLEYSAEQITAYATFGQSFTKYDYTNHFREDPNNAGAELTAVTDRLPGYQIKGGLSYRPTKSLSFFANYGYVSKAPIFDAVIDDYSATIAENPENELFNAFEIGGEYQFNRLFDVKLNYYNTKWQNRTKNISVINPDGSEGFYFITGMDQKHTGFEVEANVHPFDFLALGFFASVADWKHTNDVTGSYLDYGSGTAEDVEYNYYTKDLKIGDAPMTQLGLMLTVYPVKQLRIQIDYRHNKDHYSYWDPFTRTDENDREQTWMAPAYSLYDLHFYYQVPLKGKSTVELFAHIFNVFDEIYIQDAVDNSRYNGYYLAGSHNAMSAEVFIGLPRTYNVGVKYGF